MSARRWSDDAALVAYCEFFERLVEDDLGRLAERYTADARFVDPFNDVRGVDAIRAIFAHMFDALDAPRFVIVDAVADGDQCFLTWEFRFRLRRLRPGQALCIVGATQIRFAGDGRIALHRDWWDAAEELYEKLPALGALMRWLKRRANA